MPIVGAYSLQKVVRRVLEAITVLLGCHAEVTNHWSLFVLPAVDLAALVLAADLFATFAAELAVTVRIVLAASPTNAGHAFSIVAAVDGALALKRTACLGELVLLW